MKTWTLIFWKDKNFAEKENNEDIRHTFKSKYTVKNRLQMVLTVPNPLVRQWQVRSFVYTQSPFIRTSLIRTSAEFLGKFKTRALGGSNLRTTSKNLRTASAQIFKAKNQFVDESIVDGPQKRSKWVNYTALRSGNLDD